MSRNSDDFVIDGLAKDEIICTYDVSKEIATEHTNECKNEKGEKKKLKRR